MSHVVGASLADRSAPHAGAVRDARDGIDVRAEHGVRLPRAVVRRLEPLGRLARNETLRRGALAVVDQGLVGVANFATSVCVGRFCGKADLGTYAEALGLVLFARCLQEQLVAAPYTVRSQRRSGADLESYGGSSLLQHFAFTLPILALLGLLAFGGLRGLVSADLGHVAGFLLPCLPLLLLREHVRQFLFARLDMPRAVALDACVSLLQIGLLLALGFHGALTVERTFGAIALAAACGCGGWWVLRRQVLRLDRTCIAADWRENWIFGRWAAASQVLGSGAAWVMPWIVVAAHGRVETGQLAACTTLVGVANLFVIGMGNFLSPQVARAHAEGGTRALRRVLLVSGGVFVAALVPFCVASGLLGGRVAVAVYGPDYGGAGLLLGLLSANLLVGSVTLVAGNGLWALDRPSANFRADACALAATVVSTVLLVGRCGVAGAAAATLIGTSVGALVRCATLRSCLREASGAEQISRAADTVAAPAGRA